MGPTRRGVTAHVKRESSDGGKCLCRFTVTTGVSGQRCLYVTSGSSRTKSPTVPEEEESWGVEDLSPGEGV